jgi:hypothetical protein
LHTVFPFLTFDEIDQARHLSFFMLTSAANLTVTTSSNLADMLEEYRFQGENYLDVDLAGNTVYRGYKYEKLLKTVVNGRLPTHARGGRGLGGAAWKAERSRVPDCA